MYSVPNELLPAFCYTPRDVLTLSVVCTRFNEYFRGTAPVFTICRVSGLASQAFIYTVRSNWYSRTLELGDGHVPKQVHDKYPKYVLTTDSVGQLWHFATLPWFYPLAPHGPSYFTRNWWFKLAQRPTMVPVSPIKFEKYNSSEIDGLVTHRGDGCWIVPINIAAAGDDIKYARALYKKMEVAWS